MDREAAGMTKTGGGAFLAGPSPFSCVRTPEDLPAEALLMADTMERFVRSEVLPREVALEAREEGLLRRLMQEAGGLGLLAGGIPPAHDGLGLSRAGVALLCERAALSPSFALTHNVHSGVATLPLAWFGTEEQKAQYLPALASGEKIGAFALTEANAGSDALSLRCQAAWAADGYRLSGTKNWITNAGIADLFTVFARVEGAGVTTFLVERNTRGVAVGREEEKMGLRGASTRALFLDGVAVHESAVLGAVGSGHRAALHPLNVGRLNIGAGALGACKANLQTAVRYASARRQFGHSLADFGLIQGKLGEMAARTFAAESVVYRVAGLLDDGMARDAALPPRAAEEYAVECALVKICATEAQAFVVDESLQIHGGYGFSEAYPAARAYRDARVTRLFEGTNEINRLTIADQLARRVRVGRLVFDAAPEADVSPLAGLRTAAREALIALWARFPSSDAAQEAYAACADMVLSLFAAESALLRAARLTGRARELGEDAAGIILANACAQSRTLARAVCCDLGDCDLWARLSEQIPDPWFDAFAARRRLAEALRNTDGGWLWPGGPGGIT
jgi:alkylation response protein AidB-like acyl-CoA dehydrogenase